MIATGDTKVLIDAFSGSQYYVSPSDSLVTRIMENVPPFDNIDYLLITHDHPDHFNAAMVSRYLKTHPGVECIASSHVYGTLAADSLAGPQRVVVELQRGGRTTIQGGKAEVTVLRLDHGGLREVDNLAFLVTAGGHTFFHVGDARLMENVEFLQAVDWTSRRVELLFLEFFDRGSDVESVIDTLIRPQQVVLMHIPGGEEEKVRLSDDKVHERTVVFGKEGETRRFEGL
jgi:L-ascorbate metabolism protein UlaG (beta-lactamase superfamily)